MITKEFLQSLIESHGNILNNASVAGLQAHSAGKSYAYAASKACVIHFTKMLARNYGHLIRVNCICPGVIDTPIFINRDFSRFENSIPMRRVGSAEEVAAAANFLVSEDAGFVNGAVLTVDGGQSL